LNNHFEDFKIYKSIESDILGNGDLDYDASILKLFDCVIASVHSNLNMSEENAMKRLIKAIENPYTTILGHPTGRLLLSRPGYPLNHEKLIDACAANKVVIELNASPYRLDIDWKWIPYAIKRGVLIAINPDAHSLAGISDINWGVEAARKGGLKKNDCLNTFSSKAFEEYLKINKK
jgi:DNA polymerase (family 10)